VAAGRLATLVGRHDRAAVHFAKARSFLPEDTELQAQLAKAYFFAGRHAQAIDELDLMIGQSKDPSPVWMHTMLGESYLAIGQANKAKVVFTDLTRREPRTAQHWANLAKASLDSNDVQRATLASTRALAIEPGNADAAMVKAYLLLRQNQPQQAKTALLGVIEQNPQNPTLLCLLGRSFQALGQCEQAARCFQAALALQPEDPVTRRLADATVNQGP
jgi:predicted Zn-dependent protease